MIRRVGIGRGLQLVALSALALVLPSCGGGGSGGSGGGNPVTGAGGQPTRTTVTEQGWALEPLDAASVDIEITGSGSGSLDATVEWTFASNDVDIYVTAVACTPDMFAAERCSYKTKADSGTTKPERVSFSVSAGDKYRFWVVNFGPQRESGTFSATLTR
jgi:hypothetical protein